MMRFAVLSPVALSLSKGRSSFFTRLKEVQGFDKLSPNGDLCNG